MSNSCGTCPDCLCNLGNILQVYAAVHWLRIRRHDDVIEMLARKFRSTGYVIKLDRRLIYNNSFHKPDSVAWIADHPDGETLVLDRTIFSDDERFKQSQRKSEEGASGYSQRITGFGKQAGGAGRRSRFVEGSAT